MTGSLAPAVRRPIRKVGTSTYALASWAKLSFSTSASTGNTGSSDHHGIQTVPAAASTIDVDAFRKLAWTPEVPLQIQGHHNLPAMKKWFSRDSENGSRGLLSSYLGPHDSTVLSYEYIMPHPTDCHSTGARPGVIEQFRAWAGTLETYERDLLPRIVDELLQFAAENQSRFCRFQAPLSFIMLACQFNHSRTQAQRIKQLYVAQSDLNDLPDALSSDLPVPELVKRAGKGDVYNSSVWLGLQPTYTPFHRDPNPNLFCQMVGKKTVRLLRPQHGSALYTRVRRELGSMGNSRFRGSEMMEGPERELLHEAVWANPRSPAEMQQALLAPGDALFIPKGWWHSVASIGGDAELNASANWWFR
ncbi:Clavaminate synthase-like protein [Xylariomycetidae sp. FL0641]|nr:Clavaminate synthase-like protein [Xylariomycetidae sp. FL0641]